MGETFPFIIGGWNDIYADEKEEFYHRTTPTSQLSMLEGQEYIFFLLQNLAFWTSMVKKGPRRNTFFYQGMLKNNFIVIQTLAL